MKSDLKSREMSFLQSESDNKDTNGMLGPCEPPYLHFSQRRWPGFKTLFFRGADTSNTLF